MELDEAAAAELPAAPVIVKTGVTFPEDPIRARRYVERVGRLAGKVKLNVDGAV